MVTNQISLEERERALKNVRKPEVLEKQNLDVRYHIEDFDTNDRPRRFLEAFAAILKHSNYKLALDHFIRMSAKCARCATTCQVYQATGDPKMNLPWTHAGMPVITLPAGRAENGLPLGLQFVAPFGADEYLIAWCEMLADRMGDPLAE